MRDRVPIGFHTENRQYFLYIKKSRSRRDGLRQCFVYPFRQKWEGYVAAYMDARAALHTHFVRSGSLMLLPLIRDSLCAGGTRLQHQRTHFSRSGYVKDSNTLKQAKSSVG